MMSTFFDVRTSSKPKRLPKKLVRGPKKTQTQKQMEKTERTRKPRQKRMVEARTIRELARSASVGRF